jgi:ketosteroid isomerase-like protein
MSLRMEIDAVLADWGWHLDHGEYDELVELFTEDARFEPHTGLELHGRDQIRARYTTRAGARTTRHIYSGLRIVRATADRVEAVSCWVNYAANKPAPVLDEAATYLIADFHDVFLQGPDGGWRIHDRTIVPVFRDPTRAPISA